MLRSSVVPISPLAAGAACCHTTDTQLCCWCCRFRIYSLSSSSCLISRAYRWRYRVQPIGCIRVIAGSLNSEKANSGSPFKSSLRSWFSSVLAVESYRVSSGRVEVPQSWEMFRSVSLAVCRDSRFHSYRVVWALVICYITSQGNLYTSLW